MIEDEGLFGIWNWMDALLEGYLLHQRIHTYVLRLACLINTTWKLGTYTGLAFPGRIMLAKIIFNIPFPVSIP